MDTIDLRKHRCRTVFKTIGFLLIVMPNGIECYWGSISVYILSYMASRLPVEPALIEAPLVVSLFNGFWTLGLLVGGLVKHYCTRNSSPKKMILFVTWVVICDVSYFVTYYTLQSSFWAMNIIYGAVAGIATGAIFGFVLDELVTLSPDHLGLLCSLAFTSCSLGAFLIGQVVTWYANPSNLIPNLEMGSTVYFGQVSVVDQAPSIFYLLGSFSIFSHVLGSAIAYYDNIIYLLHKISRLFISNDKLETDPMIFVRENSKDTDTEKNTTTNTDLISTFNEYNCSTSTHCSVVTSSESCINVGNQMEMHSNGNEIGEGDKDGEKNQHIYLRQLLKNPKVYVFALSFMVVDYTTTIAVSYLKLFGQLWIHNDHFLTNTGTSYNICAIILRGISGLALDRSGSGKCLTVFSVTLTLVSAFIYFTPMTNAWLYAIMAVVYTSSEATMLVVCFSAATMSLNKDNVSSYMGLLTLPSLVADSLCPFIISTILQDFGWFGLYITASAAHLVLYGLFVIFTF